MAALTLGTLVQVVDTRFTADFAVAVHTRTISIPPTTTTIVLRTMVTGTTIQRVTMLDGVTLDCTAACLLP